MVRPRVRTAGRNFDRVDAAAFVAASAAGLALAWVEAASRWPMWLGVRAEEPFPIPALFAVDVACRAAALLLVPLCLLSLAAYLRRPRPRRGRLFDKPGIWPGVACVVVVAANLLVEPVNIVALHAPPSWREYLLYRCDVFGQQPIGQAVCVAWAVLLVSGRWRPERGWVDRTGRALGAAAVVLFLASELVGIADTRARDRQAAGAAERAPVAPPPGEPQPPEEAGDPFGSTDAGQAPKEGR